MPETDVTAPEPASEGRRDGAGFRLFVGIPTHSETLTTPTVHTLLELQRTALARGWTIQFDYYSGAYISDLRNLMTKDFLRSDADAMLMIDSDQGFGADLVVRLVESGHLVSGALYPRRHFAFDRVTASSAGDLPRLLRQASAFVGELIPDVAGGEATVVNGLARALTLGAGALLIRREAIVRLQARYPELEGQGLVVGNAQSRPDPDNWGLFNPYVPDGGHAPVGEDYAFCYRWRDGCGGEVWADVVSPVSHVGRYVHHGSYVEHVRALDPRPSPPPAPPAEPPAEAGCQTLTAWALKAEAAGRPEAALRVLLRAGLADPAAPDRLDAAIRLTLALERWPQAAGLAAQRLETGTLAPEPWLDLQFALVRCGGLAEARELARRFARLAGGRGRLRLLAALALIYAEAGRLDRARRLTRWLTRRDAAPQPWRPPTPEGAPGEAQAWRDATALAKAGDRQEALAACEAWLARTESLSFSRLRVQLLAELGDFEPAFDRGRACLAALQADWRVLQGLAWAAGETGRLPEALALAEEAALGVGDEQALDDAYGFVRTCAAFDNGAGAKAAEIVGDGLDSLIRAPWLNRYADGRAAQAPHFSSPTGTPGPQVGGGRGVLHVVTPLAAALGGSEQHAADLVQQARLRGRSARLWSIGPCAPNWSERGAVTISPELQSFPQSGVLVLVGAWFLPGDWLRQTRFERIVIVYNSFHAPQLERLRAKIRATTGQEPNLVFVSPIMQAEVGLPGTVAPSVTDLSPFSPRERADEQPFTVGRVSRDTPDKHTSADLPVYRALLESGAHVRLLGGACLGSQIEHPNLELLRQGAAPVPAFLQSLDVFYYRTGLWVEPCGRVVFEAMASSLPVVLDRRSGNAPFLRDGVDAVLVSSGEEGLQAILALRDDVALRRRLGQQGRARVLALMSPATMCDLWELLDGNPQST